MCACSIGCMLYEELCKPQLAENRQEHTSGEGRHSGTVSASAKQKKHIRKPRSEPGPGCCRLSWIPPYCKRRKLKKQSFAVARELEPEIRPDNRPTVHRRCDTNT